MRAAALLPLVLAAACAAPASERGTAPTRVVLDPATPLDDRLPPRPEKTDHPYEPWLFDIRHYAIDVALDFERETVAGEVAITFRTLHDAPPVLPLDIVDLDIASVTDPDGAAVPFEVVGDELLVALGDGFLIGQERTVTVAYSGRPMRGLYFNRVPPGTPDAPAQAFTQGECEDTRHWLPCHDFPDDRATSVTRVTVPGGMHVSAAGELASVTSASGGRRTFTYRMDVPHVAYLLTIVAGDYEVVHEEGVVPLEFVAEARHAENAAYSLRKTDAILRFFGDYTGRPYPYTRYAQCCVRDFMFGGMENITATTLTDNTVHPPHWEPARTSHGLVAHEAVHQWFGDLITCRDWSHIWLNEGFATYFTQLWREHDEGEPTFLAALRGTMNGATRACERARRPVVSNRYVEPFDLFFDGHAYGGGAARLHMLRVLLGDETFRRGVRLYVERHAGTVVTTRELERAMSDAAGEDLRWFFDQWLRTPGRPKLTIRWTWDDAARVLRVTVTQTQDEKGFPQAYRLPLDLACDLPRGRTEDVRLSVTQREETFEVPLPSAPRLVRVDPRRGLVARLDVERSPEDWTTLSRADPSPAGRIDAVEALGAIARDRKRKQPVRRAARAALRAALDDPFHQVRTTALQQVKRSGGGDVTAELLSLYERDEDLRVRLAVLRALRDRDGDDAARAALRAAATSDHDLIRAEALPGVGRLGGPGAYELLLAALEWPGWHSRARGAALGALADLGDERAYPVLVRYAAVDADPRTRTNALRSLGRMGAERPEYTDAVLLHLHDERRAVRKAAINALGTLADPGALAPLREAFETETWEANRRAIRRALQACRRTAVDRGEWVTVEAIRGARLREEHAALRDGGDPQDADRRRRLRELKTELDALGVPASPAPEEGAVTGPGRRRAVAVAGPGVCDPETAAAAERLGAGLAALGAVVVTGGRTGVMEAASRGAREAGGTVVAVLPGTDPSEANSWAEIVLPTGLGDARNALVATAGDLLVAFLGVGGPGTLSEVALALKRRVPVVLVGTHAVPLPDGADAVTVEGPDAALAVVARRLGGG